MKEILEQRKWLVYLTPSPPPPFTPASTPPPPVCVIVCEVAGREAKFPSPVFQYLSSCVGPRLRVFSTASVHKILNSNWPSSGNVETPPEPSPALHLQRVWRTGYGISFFVILLALWVILNPPRLRSVNTWILFGFWIWICNSLITDLFRIQARSYLHDFCKNLIIKCKQTDENPRKM